MSCAKLTWVGQMVLERKVGKEWVARRMHYSAT